MTFKPNVNSKQSILSQLNSKNTYIPDYDKTVYRLFEARKSKEPSPSVVKTLSESPLFYLNVVMEGSHPAKVPFFQTDTLKSITDKVASLMELNGDPLKLQEILKMQIMPALR